MGLLSRLRDAVGRLGGRGEPTATDGGSVDTGDGVVPRRVHAEREGEFVVFHIGMRVNAWWKVHRWLPVFVVAPRMVRELRADSDSGLLGSRTVVGPGLRNVGFVQYWESFESLRDYARDSDYLHLDAWGEYNQGEANSEAAVGIWHETYLIDEYESVYNNMPPHALGATTGTDLVPASGQRESAAGRLGQTDGSDAPLAPGGD